jgi:hypothetical protein
VIRAPPGAYVAHKRNLAVKEANGPFLAWFDDDDWSHPNRLSRLAETLSAGAPMAGGTRAWFVDLWGDGCRRYFGGGHIIFNTAGFHRDVARAAAFDEGMRRGSDTIWMRCLERRHGAAARLLREDCLAMWLCHDQNLSNPRTFRTFPVPTQQLEWMIGHESWGDTSRELAGLRDRLGPRPGAQARAGAKSSYEATSSRAPAVRRVRRLYPLR